MNPTASTELRTSRPRTTRLAGFVALLFGALVWLGAASVAHAQSASKIAVIDTQRAIMETEDGLRVQATLKKLFDQRQSDLDVKQRKLQDDRDALEAEAKAGKTSKEALQKKYETLQQQAADLQGQLVDAQREMQRKEKEMTTPILQGMLGIVRRIAAQEGYDMVLDKSVAPFFRAELELTDRAIQMYNGTTGASDPAKAPAATPAAPKPGAKPAAAPPAKKN